MVANKMPDVRRMPVPPQKKEPEPDYTRWLTRQDVADLFGVGYTTVMLWERKGYLTPRKITREIPGDQPRVVVIYDPSQLKNVPRRERTRAPDPGEVEARCVELFRSGKTIADVVVTERQTFEFVEAVYQKWLDHGGSHVVITEVARDELERRVGAFASVAELVERLEQLLPKRT